MGLDGGKIEDNHWILGIILVLLVSFLNNGTKKKMSTQLSKIVSFIRHIWMSVKEF